MVLSYFYSPNNSETAGWVGLTGCKQPNWSKTGESREGKSQNSVIPLFEPIKWCCHGVCMWPHGCFQTAIMSKAIQHSKRWRNHIPLFLDSGFDYVPKYTNNGFGFAARNEPWASLHLNSSATGRMSSCYVIIHYFSLIKLQQIPPWKTNLCQFFPLLITEVVKNFHFLRV